MEAVLDWRIVLVYITHLPQKQAYSHQKIWRYLSSFHLCILFFIIQKISNIKEIRVQIAPIEQNPKIQRFRQNSSTGKL
tara:strand:- start:344 stop:580 length:237 start_codon:yes stop_codon:yes gene_type:complete